MAPGPRGGYATPVHLTLIPAPLARALRSLAGPLLLPRQRLDALRQLQRRFLAQPAPAQACAEELQLATVLRELRQEVGALMGPLAVCARCAVGRPPPHGEGQGGFCCGGATEEIFDADELCALRLAGTTMAHLVPARPGLGGCLFRGPEGCVLPLAHRPSVCVVHLCPEASRELHRAGRLDTVERRSAELHLYLHHFRRRRAQGLDDRLLGLALRR